MSSSASPSNPPSASQLSKASKNLEKVRRKAYDVFTRVNGASSPEELIGSDAREGEEGSCWIWLVNLGESGGDLEGKRTTLRETIRGDGWTWVPLLGMPCSLVHFSTPSAASQALLSLNPLPPSDASTSKPLFLESCPSYLALSKLSPTPSNSSALELSPSRLRFPSSSFELHLNFLSPSEETLLISHLRSEGGWSLGQAISKRLSVHFGPHFDYTNNAVREEERPLPDYLEAIIGRLPYQTDGEEVGGMGGRPDQATFQCYPSGSGIPPHVDTHSPFGPVIWGISMGSTVVMELKECGEVETARMKLAKRSLASQGPAEPSPLPAASSTSSVESRPTSASLSPTLSSSTASHLTSSAPLDSALHKLVLVDLPPRSLLVMKGPSRYCYTHAIRPRRLDPIGEWGQDLRERGERYSLTFRTVVNEIDASTGERKACECEWPRWCDSRIG